MHLSVDPPSRDSGHPSSASAGSLVLAFSSPPRLLFVCSSRPRLSPADHGGADAAVAVVGRRLRTARSSNQSH